MGFRDLELQSATPFERIDSDTQRGIRRRRLDFFLVELERYHNEFGRWPLKYEMARRLGWGRGAIQGMCTTLERKGLGRTRRGRIVLEGS